MRKNRLNIKSDDFEFIVSEFGMAPAIFDSDFYCDGQQTESKPLIR